MGGKVYTAATYTAATYTAATYTTYTTATYTFLGRRTPACVSNERTNEQEQLDETD